MKLNKRDIILITFILIISAIIFLFTNIFKTKGNTVVITIDGDIYKTVSLDDDAEIFINNDYGKNKIIIKNNTVYMKEANCKDLICVEHKPISNNNESIVCLPHKLVVKINTIKNSEFDAIT